MRTRPSRPANLGTHQRAPRHVLLHCSYHRGHAPPKKYDIGDPVRHPVEHEGRLEFSLWVVATDAHIMCSRSDKNAFAMMYVDNHSSDHTLKAQ